MMQRLVVGTHNRKKGAELLGLLRKFAAELVTLSEVADALEVEETGDSFAANAALKATHQAAHLQAWVLAEDSGICVDALDGRPGVYSVTVRRDGYRPWQRIQVEAVLGAMAAITTPLLLLFALAAPWFALLAALGIVAASVSATLIQIWFRAQAKRSAFRRRQTSSRIATFAEAFSSILWAATTGFAAAESWFALAPAGAALAVLAFVRMIRPNPESAG